MKHANDSIHPEGEEIGLEKTALSSAMEVDTFAGKLHVEWDPTASVTPLVATSLFHRISQNRPSLCDDGHPLRMKCSAVPGFRKPIVQRWAQQLVHKNAHAISDGLSPFKGVADAGIRHTPIVTGGGAASMEILALQWVNIMLGNLKNALHGLLPCLSRQALAALPGRVQLPL